MLHPRHRADCGDFFVAPDQTDRIDFKVPADVINDLEREAFRAGRTWNDQLTYVAEVFLGRRPPDFDDPRSVEDWRTLLRSSLYRLTEAGDWLPFACLGEQRHEHETIPQTRQRTQ